MTLKKCNLPLEKLLNDTTLDCPFPLMTRHIFYVAPIRRVDERLGFRMKFWTDFGRDQSKGNALLQHFQRCFQNTKRMWPWESPIFSKSRGPFSSTPTWFQRLSKLVPISALRERKFQRNFAEHERSEHELLNLCLNIPKELSVARSERKTLNLACKCQTCFCCELEKVFSMEENKGLRGKGENKVK